MSLRERKFQTPEEQIIKKGEFVAFWTINRADRKAQRMNYILPHRRSDFGLSVSTLTIAKVN